ncbi:hypothetical protein PR048_017460 [Dryococelus australis]|uniref:RNA-directed DNA polymerase n=1 Tax=Dryococelus australis TaxID=614101 RepID=A0ABQ9H9M7_9NEOP|nr:hypothetical protein PR048_017460 [Dryococelus australis]
MDDILLHVESINELYAIAETAMKKLAEAGLTLNRSKIAKIPGNDKLFVKIYPKRGRALCTSVGITRERRSLEWKLEQENAFEDLKDSLKSPPLLRYLDHTKPVTISVDASSHSVASVLLQENHPVFYASKALTKTQQNYSQIEKEAFASLSACKKFHEYFRGNQKVTIETDHKPLEAISKKFVYTIPQPDFTRSSSKSFHTILQSDTKRVTAMTSQNQNAQAIYEVQVVILMSVQCIAQLKDAIHTSTELSALCRGVQRYHFQRERTLIPPFWKPLILSQLHCSHKGVQGTLAIAHDHVFWPDMTQDIISYVQKYATCQKIQNDPPQESLSKETVPSRPWMYVASDMFNYKGKNFLLVADSYSGYFDFHALTSSTSNEVIKMLKTWFAQHGIPDELSTDGGPQYASHQFQKFREEWNVRYRI